jgi:hypothetical protein
MVSPEVFLDPSDDRERGRSVMTIVGSGFPRRERGAGRLLPTVRRTQTPSLAGVKRQP